MPASADFGDAEDLRPLGATFDIGGHGTPTPYSTSIQNMLSKQYDEIKGKVQGTLNLPNQWKRRLRDFLNQKNNELLDFLKLSVPSHPTLGPGEVLIRRFGNPQVSPTHPSVRDFVLDCSGEDVIAEMSAAIENFRGEGGVKDYAAATRLIYDEYREAGDAILIAQSQLKAKLDRLDRIQGRLSNLFEIDPTTQWGPLMEASEDYLKQIFKSSDIEPEYRTLVAKYRRFVVLRELVQMSRVAASAENEPLCSICLTETVQFALTPCGHTFCQTCVRRQNTTCFMCRANIKERVKLFFG